MSSRSYLSIGDVLTLLRQEFPDVTISKIRFLESQGLVNPERTPSGYRKFYEHDVERLRWVLRQQRENFLPLKVIKDRLDDDPNGTASEEVQAQQAAGRGSGEAGWDAGTDAADEPVLVGQRSSGSASAVGSSSRSERPIAAGGGPTLPGIPGAARRAGSSARAGDLRAGAGRSGGAPARSRSPAQPAPTDASRAHPPDRSGELRARNPRQTRAAAETGSGGAETGSGGAETGSGGAETGSGGAETEGRRRQPADRAASHTTARGAGHPGPASDGTGASLSFDELSAASGLDAETLRELQEYGLLTATSVAGLDYFDQEALTVAMLAAELARFGVEPRHLRLYKNAADREAGFVEQIVLPLVRQRNPDARARAQETVDELAGLGQQLRATLLRLALRSLLDG